MPIKPMRPGLRISREQLLIYWEWVVEMAKNTSIVLYVLALIVVVVALDILFFRHHVWERLIVNIGIVLLFLGFYLRFLKKP